ncbi:MAG: hypothetical protein ACI9DH_000243 [Halioglobus sp.]|jgi:hypothetical protein
MAFVVFNSLFLAVFILSALVQYNDTDAIIWIAMYLSAAGMCVSAFRKKSLYWLPPLLLFACIGWIMGLTLGFIGTVSMAEITASIKMQSGAVEEAREVGGLAMIGFWTAYLIYRRWRGLHGQR